MTDGRTETERGSGSGVRGAEPLLHPDAKSSLSQNAYHFREFVGDLRPPFHSNGLEEAAIYGLEAAAEYGLEAAAIYGLEAALI